MLSVAIAHHLNWILYTRIPFLRISTISNAFQSTCHKAHKRQRLWREEASLDVPLRPGRAVILKSRGIANSLPLARHQIFIYTHS